MLVWMRFFLKLSFFKAAPQDAPSSQALFYVSIFSYYTCFVIIASFTQETIQALIAAAIQTILIVFITNLFLWVKKTPARFVQSINAIMGSGSMIFILSLPVFSFIVSMGTEVTSLIAGLWIAIIIWQTLVIGHVLRHAMDLSMLASFGAAMVYMYLAFAVTLRILKVMSFSVGSAG